MAPRGIRQCIHDVTAYLILLISVSTLGTLQFGYRLAELNAPQDVITCHKKSISTFGLVAKWISSARARAAPPAFLPDCIPMTEVAFATVSSAFTLGALVGALCAGPICSRRGRLPAMRMTAALSVIGGVVETLAGSTVLLAVGRLISGVAGGASTVIVPLYISEISPPDERGLFGVTTQISICLGILSSQTLGYFLSHDNAWRWVLAVGACVGTAQALGLVVAPESPAWLAARGHVARAKRTLQQIRGKGFDIGDEVDAWGTAAAAVDAEEEALLAQLHSESLLSPEGGKTEPVHLGFFEVVKDPLYRPAIVAVVGIMFAQQLCGINSIIMYSVSLLADLLPISSALLTIIISCVNLITTVACSPLPDRLGRKTCLLVSIIGQGTSSLVLALSIMLGVKILSAIAVLFFVGFFAVGLGPVPFMMAAELVGQEAVGATQSWCLAGSFVTTFIVAQFFPIVNKALNSALGGQGWVYFIFAALAAIFAVFVFWNVPETKGKKDADEVWGRTRRLD